jgi:hypothetical protein
MYFPTSENMLKESMAWIARLMQSIGSCTHLAPNPQLISSSDRAGRMILMHELPELICHSVLRVGEKITPYIGEAPLHASNNLDLPLQRCSTTDLEQYIGDTPPDGTHPSLLVNLLQMNVSTLHDGPKVRSASPKLKPCGRSSMHTEYGSLRQHLAALTSSSLDALHSAPA